MSARVLVVGDANVDLVLQGDIVPRFGQAEQTLERADLVLGGSACIMASGIAKLGIATSVVGVIGNDEFGEVTRAALVAAGVETSTLRVDDAVPTGISVILSAPGDRSILTLPGTVPLLSATEVRGAVELVAPVHVHFASYFLQPALAAELPELVGWLRERGVRTSLDTNWDPDERWSGLENVLPNLDYLFPNLHELRAIAGALGSVEGESPDDESPDDVALARGLAARGPTVVVKAGADGGWSVTSAGDVTTAVGPTVEVIDTTGAGDSFDAGYLAAVLSAVDDEQTRLAWAATAGSLSTLGRGGTTAQPTRAELLASLHT